VVKFTKETPKYSKLKAGGIAQVVKCLPELTPALPKKNENTSKLHFACMLCFVGT
jgi:hypothetical protein